MDHSFLSLPQLFGYATFACGMVTFSRKKDGSFKLWLTVQNILYGVHFALMGNPAAVAGMVLSVARNLLSMRTRSFKVAIALLVANTLIGCWVVTSLWHVIPLLATAVATLSMFRLQRLPMRVGMLISTLMWVGNNILTGSIGGTAMECCISVMSIITILRLYRDTLRNGAVAEDLRRR